MPHPLAADAVDTLARLYNRATGNIDRIERRLREEYYDLPRGPIPLQDRQASFHTEAYHLLIAMAALGDPEAQTRLADFERKAA